MLKSASLLIAAGFLQAICCSPLCAQNPAAPANAASSPPAVLSILVENDSIAPDKTDRHYTHGTALDITWQSQFADDIISSLPVSASSAAFGLTLGQLMFTPDNLATQSLVTNDQPYAGYLYAGAYLQRTDSDRSTLDHFQLDLGTVGYPALAGFTQRLVHKLGGVQRPNGWRNQLQDEPTIQLTYRKKWRIALAENLFDSGLACNLVPALALSAGTVHRFAELSSTFRIGWNIPADFGPARLADVAAGSAFASSPSSGFSFYLYSRAAARAVQYNHLLDGSEFQHEQYSVRSRPLLGEFEIGTALAYHRDPLTVELGYSVIFLTDSFYHQQHDDKYASIHFKIAYCF